MTKLQFLGDRPPGIEGDELPGRLIVLEGTDGVGRSTHIAMLKEWLEDRGYAVLDTGLTRSELAGPGIKRAKEGNTLDPFTLNLFYATDFWDRLERQIIPALRAGMVALADRYVSSLIARALVRGLPREWIQNLYGIALVPDCVIYLDIDVEHLLPRVLSSTGFDYWESGQDFLPGVNVYESFVEYQTQLLQTFKDLAVKGDFRVIDARGSVADIFTAITMEVSKVIETMSTES
ncbi:MAG: dTMP kinase [Actinomycetota bacterium]